MRITSHFFLPFPAAEVALAPNSWCDFDLHPWAFQQCASGKVCEESVGDMSPYPGTGWIPFVTLRTCLNFLIFLHLQ